jgi:hypothetical protein
MGGEFSVSVPSVRWHGQVVLGVVQSNSRVGLDRDLVLANRCAVHNKNNIFYLMTKPVNGI